MEKKQQISAGNSAKAFGGNTSDGNLQEEFARLVREHKSTIYTVCYMFSKDNDEVNDLFQEILVNLW